MKRNSMMSRKMLIFVTIFFSVLIGFLSFTATFYFATKEMNENMGRTQSSDRSETESENETDGYHFASEQILEENYEDYGKAMGFKSADEYELAAVSVINDPNVLHKSNENNGFEVYYNIRTNEFVKVSEDGCIMEYFTPESGKLYYDSQ